MLAHYNILVATSLVTAWFTGLFSFFGLCIALLCDAVTGTNIHSCKCHADLMLREQVRIREEQERRRRVQRFVDFLRHHSNRTGLNAMACAHISQVLLTQAKMDTLTRNPGKAGIAMALRHAATLGDLVKATDAYMAAYDMQTHIDKNLKLQLVKPQQNSIEQILRLPV